MVRLVSCWEKCLTLVTPLAVDKVAEGKEIFTEDSFTEFLIFCRDNGCFPTSDVYTLIRYGVCVYGIGDEDNNYFEEDHDRKEQLLDILFTNEQ